MKIIIVGCGRVGSELAFRLFQKGHQVTVIDQNEQAFNNLNTDFRGRTVEGEAMNRDVLHRAGIETADGLVAVTNSDPLNAVVSHLARSVYGIKNIVVRNYDPVYRPLYETFGLQIISSSSWGAQRLEEMLYHAEMHTVFSAGNGEVEIYEFAITQPWDGHLLGELISSSDCVAVSLTRAGTAILPKHETQLTEGDILLVGATFFGIEAIRLRLNNITEK